MGGDPATTGSSPGRILQVGPQIHRFYFSWSLAERHIVGRLLAGKLGFCPEFLRTAHGFVCFFFLKGCACTLLLIFIIGDTSSLCFFSVVISIFGGVSYGWWFRNLEPNNNFLISISFLEILRLFLRYFRVRNFFAKTGPFGGAKRNSRWSWMISIHSSWRSF